MLFSQLGSAFQHDKPKHAILNADDEASSYFEKVTAAEIMTYGLEQEADVMAKNIQIKPKGTQFDLITPIGTKM